MRVFVAGANGAVGRRLVPMLVARGHSGHRDDDEREVEGCLVRRRSARRRSSSTDWTPRRSARRSRGRSRMRSSTR